MKKAVFFGVLVISAIFSIESQDAELKLGAGGYVDIQFGSGKSPQQGSTESVPENPLRNTYWENVKPKSTMYIRFRDDVYESGFAEATRVTRGSYTISGNRVILEKKLNPLLDDSNILLIEGKTLRIYNTDIRFYK